MHGARAFRQEITAKREHPKNMGIRPPLIEASSAGRGARPSAKTRTSGQRDRAAAQPHARIDEEEEATKGKSGGEQQIQSSGHLPARNRAAADRSLRSAHWGSSSSPSSRGSPHSHLGEIAPRVARNSKPGLSGRSTIRSAARAALRKLGRQQIGCPTSTPSYSQAHQLGSLMRGNSRESRSKP